METVFEMGIPLAVPSVVKLVMSDEKGKQFLHRQLSEASFHVRLDEESKSVVASKQDPARTYGFWFRQDDLVFKMKIYSDVIGNPHRFFLQTMADELRLIISLAEEYLTGSAVSRRKGKGKPGKYIG